ncbi:hypothetical protein BC833DRAFT_609424 [Globomyces pollinis-pini]|nr:hypothetical protein BC833DRAFT_609424 [Globomyces pollinis-pini]
MNVRSIALTLYNTAPILFDHLPLNLHSFSLLYKKFTNEGCQKLSNFLKSSMDLKRVSIHQYASIDDTCDCSTESLEMLQNAFVDHTNLIEMSFHLNYFDDSSYEKLSTLIQRNRQLTKLNIVDRERTSNPYLATLMEDITQHPTLVHLSIFGSDQTLPYIYKLIKKNKVLKSIRFLFINNPINYNLTMSDCSPLPESLAINTTLNTLDIQFHPIVYQSLYLSMKSILANNPGFKRNTFVSEGWSLLSRSKYNLFNEIAVRLVTYRPLLILLSTSITNDITSHIFSHYTCTFELDERLLNKILLDRMTIGKLINREVTYSHGKFNETSPSFDYNELIRACARLSIA